jgi:hypothetical protein
MRAMGALPVFQERVRGSVLHFIALTDRHHRMLSSVSHLTTRLGRSESGQSARALIVPTDTTLRSRVQAFLSEVRWFGLADLQFWITSENKALLTDFNGRIYGGLALPYAGGLLAIDAWARLATGRETTLTPTRTGVRYRALEGDLRHALAQPGLRAIVQALKALVPCTHCVHPIFSWSDPLPTLTYLARLPLRAMNEGGG